MERGIFHIVLSAILFASLASCVPGGFGSTESGVDFSDSELDTKTALPQIVEMAPTGQLISLNDIVLTIKTKNEAECRYDESDKSYSLMRNRLDPNEASKLHSKKMSVEDQRDYKFYIRCKDRFFQVSQDATIIEFTTVGTIDFAPPVIKVLSPIGQLPATTNEVELAVDTDEKSICRYDEKNILFDQMVKFLSSNSLGMTHKASMRVEAAKKYEFFISCRDVKGNTSIDSSIINFEILPAGSTDTVVPVITNALPSGELAPGTTQELLRITTSENSTCRFSNNTSSTFEQMTKLSVTGGLNHSQQLQGLEDAKTYRYYVICRDPSNNDSAKKEVVFSVKAPVVNLDGVVLYANNCMQCHGILEDSTKKNSSAQDIQNAIDNNPGMNGIAYLKALTSAQVGSIALALKTEEPENSAPSITTNQNSLIVIENNLGSIEIIGTDKESDNLRYEVSPSLSFIEQNQTGSNLNIKVQPKTNDNGIYNLIVKAFDTKDLSSNVLNIQINIKKPVAENTPPVISIDNAFIRLEAETVKSFEVTASDAQNDSITFSFINKPSFLVNQDFTNGLNLSARPSSSDVGEYMFSILASDSKGASSSREVSIIVDPKPLNLEDQYIADQPTVQYRLADRHLFYSFMVYFFGPSASSHSDLKKIRYNRAIFGGACDHFAQNFLPGSTRHNNSPEFPGYSCTSSRSFPNYVRYQSSFHVGYSTIRSGHHIKSCERMVALRNNVAVKYALSQVDLNENSEINEISIQKLYRLFYRHRDIPQELQISLMNQKSSFSEREDFWSSMTLSLCISPWWQEI